MSTAAISVKASEKLRELIDKYKIELEDIRKILEVLEILIFEITKEVIDAIIKETLELEEEARRRALLEDIQRKAMKLSEKLKHISDKEIAALIREDRDSR